MCSGHWIGDEGNPAELGATVAGRFGALLLVKWVRKRTSGLDSTTLAVMIQEYGKTEQNLNESNYWVCWVLLRFERVSAIKTSVSEVLAGKIALLLKVGNCGV